MASKQGLKLFDISQIVRNTGLKMTDFVKYSLLRMKKSALIVGDVNDEVTRLLKDQMLNKKWNVTVVTQRECQTQETNNNLSFLTLQNNNYKEIEQILSEKTFNSILVPPVKQQQQLQFQSESFATEFAQLHQSTLMQSVFAYRLAHKCLAKTGVMVLTCGQKEFLEYKQTQRRPTQDQIVYQTFGKNVVETVLGGMVSHQVAYLSIVAGDRDYTHLSSCSLTALANQVSLEEPEGVAARYLKWAEGSKLPRPGSFVLFKPAFEKADRSYVEYL